MITFPRLTEVAVIVLCLGISVSKARSALDCRNSIDHLTINQIDPVYVNE